jgi:hypothetical protein
MQGCTEGFNSGVKRLKHISGFLKKYFCKLNLHLWLWFFILCFSDNNYLAYK